MHRSWVIALSLLALLMVAPSAAANLKVGVVNVELVIAKSKAGKSAHKKLKAFLKKKEKALKDQQKELQELEQKLASQSDMVTPEARKKAYLAYQKKAAKFQEDYLQSRQEIAKKEAQLTEPILKKLQDVLQRVFTDGGYDLLLNQTAQGVLFAKEAYNLNEKVLKMLDAK